jgi:GPH family glycoside/pentoside/hexuronide:cation symporter
LANSHGANSRAGSGVGRLSTARIWAFAAAGVPAAALLLAAGTYLPPFYTGFVGVSLLAYSLATVVVRIVDLTLDPVLGWLMDRTHTRWGRFRPWFVAGVPITMLGTYMLLNPSPGAGVAYLALWYLVIWVGLSIAVLAHASWGASLAISYHERSRIYGWMTALAPIGSLVLLVLPLLTAHSGHKLTLGDPKSFHAISLLIVGAIPVTAILMLAFTPERPKVSVTRQRFGLGDYVAMMRRPTMARLILADLAYTLGPGVTSPLYAFFFGQIKGFNRAEVGFLLIFYIGAALIGGILWPFIARHINKHRAVQLASVLYAISQTSLMATPRLLFWPTAIGMLAVGFCASAFILLVRAMVADYADEMRLEQGRERAGVLYAMVTTTQKLGASINVLLVFPLLQFVFHFDPKKPVNDAFALQGLQLCYLFAPIIFVLVGAALFFGYQLDETRHAQIREALEARDAELDRALAAEPTASGAAPGGAPAVAG